MFLVLLPLIASAAEPNAGCGNLERIDQIKAFVTCQGSTALAACGGLGGYVAGRVVSAGLQKRYLKLMDAAQDTLAHDIAESVRDDARASRRLLDPKTRLDQLNTDVTKGKDFVSLRERYQKASKKELPFYNPENEAGTPADFERLLDDKKPVADQMAKAYRDQEKDPIRLGDRYREKRALEAALKAHPNGPIFEPLLKRLPNDDMQTFDVANLDYDDLPEALRREYDLRAKVTADAIRARVASGLPLDDAFIEKTSADVHAQWLKDYRRRPRAMNDVVDVTDLERQQLDRAKAMVKKGVARLREVETATLAKGLGPAIKLARKLGRAGPLAVSGIVAGPLFVAGQIADAKSTACADASSPYVNQDALNGCKPRMEVDDHVSDFLLKSPAEQREILLRNPDVCGYYKNLHQTFFAQPKFGGLTCQSVGPGRGRVTIKSTDDAGAAREYRVDVRDDQSVGAVGVYSAGGMKVRLYNFANASEDLTTKMGTDSGAARELRQLKLFVPEAVQCCAERGSTCAAQFGGATGGSSPTPPAPEATK